MENPPFSLGDASTPSWWIFHLSSRVNQSLKCPQFYYEFASLPNCENGPKTPIWKPEYFPWVPPSHRPTPCQSFHYPRPHPIHPIKIPSDGLLLAEAANVSRWVPNSAIASRPSKANMKLHLKFVHRVGRAPFTNVENMENSCFTRCSGAIHGGWKGCWFGQGRNGRATLSYPPKKKSTVAVKSWILQDPSIPCEFLKVASYQNPSWKPYCKLWPPFAVFVSRKMASQKSVILLPWRKNTWLIRGI